MYKKLFVTLLIVFALISFTACSGENSDNSGPIESKITTTTDSNSETNQTGSQGGKVRLQHVSEMLGRFGTDEGFYFYKNHHSSDPEQDSYSNVMYIDYATNKQVYLCNKINCSHNDMSCTSFIPNGNEQGIFTYGDKLYWLSDIFSENGESEGPGLIVSDLDGSNRKTLYQLESGTNWLRDFVIGDGVLYADVMFMEASDSGDGQQFLSGSNNNSRIVAIDLNSGKSKIVHNLTNQEIAGVFEELIVFSEAIDGKMVFYLFDTSSHTTVEAGRIESTTFTHSKGKIYYIKGNTLSSLDIKTGKIAEVATDLPASPSQIQAFDGFAVCEKMENSGCVAHFAVELSSGKVSQINIFKSGLEFNTPIEIEAMWGDYFLVCSGYKVEEEYVDWVGVWQDYIDQEYFTLIKKDDFFSGKAEYLTIEY